ncbi:MAG: hypothetical protein DRJ67_01625 [Thermoprotei archaeon]|nr:MAG: hypothetical protein DRJ67_01625 [Thermoprotei archaeon]
MSQLGLTLVAGGTALMIIGVAIALAGATVNSDALMFGGAMTAAVGVGLVICGFYTIVRGIFRKVTALAEVIRYMAVEKEEVEAGKKK